MSFNWKASGLFLSLIHILFDMTAATTGINETNAKKSGLEVDTVILSPMSHAAVSYTHLEQSHRKNSTA